MEVKRDGFATQRSALKKAQDSFLDKLSNLPPKAMELARLQRDVQVRNAIYLALSQQYETAMINESKESDAFLSLDKAVPAERPSKPNKPAFVVTGLLSGIALSLLAILLQRVVTEAKAQVSL